MFVDMGIYEFFTTEDLVDKFFEYSTTLQSLNATKMWWNVRRSHTENMCVSVSTSE